MRANDKRARNIDRVSQTLKPYVTDQSILHIGCVAHDANKLDPDSDEVWLHDRLDQLGSDCLGVDILPDDLKRLQAADYDVEYADAQDMDLDREFDVIVAGELIEHLTNFDGFLRSVARHLAPNGQFILTTPNAMAIHWTGLRLLGGDFINDEHTCWFDETTLAQLLGRYDFSIDEVLYVGDCDLTLSDPLFTLGRFVELVLPDRIGKSTVVAIASQQ